MSLDRKKVKYLDEQTPPIREVLDNSTSVPMDMLKEFAAVCHVGLLAHLETMPKYHESVTEALDWLEFATAVLNKGTGKEWLPMFKGMSSRFSTQKHVRNGIETTSGKMPRDHVATMWKEWRPRVLERLVDVEREIVAKFATVSCVGLLSLFSRMKQRQSRAGKHVGKWLDKAMDVLNEGRQGDVPELTGWHTGYEVPSARKPKQDKTAVSVNWEELPTSSDHQPEILWAKEWAAGGHKKDPQCKAEALKILAFNYQAFTDKERQAILLAYHSQIEQGSLI